MDVADEIRAYQRKEYLSKFIQNDVSPDNRALGETRPAVSSLPRSRSSLNLFTYKQLSLGKLSINWCTNATVADKRALS